MERCPIWKRDTRELAPIFCACGFRHPVCVDPLFLILLCGRVLDESFFANFAAGRSVRENEVPHVRFRRPIFKRQIRFAAAKKYCVAILVLRFIAE